MKNSKKGRNQEITDITLLTMYVHIEVFLCFTNVKQLSDVKRKLLREEEEFDIKRLRILGVKRK